jgi:hypothetical protein
METSLTALHERARELCGRDVEIDRTKDGQFIVLYMCFGKAPPPKGSTHEEALTRFIEYMESSRTVDPGTDEDYKDLMQRLDADQKGDDA